MRPWTQLTRSTKPTWAPLPIVLIFTLISERAVGGWGGSNGGTPVEALGALCAAGGLTPVLYGDLVLMMVVKAIFSEGWGGESGAVSTCPCLGMCANWVDAWETQVYECDWCTWEMRSPRQPCGSGDHLSHRQKCCCFLKNPSGPWTSLVTPRGIRTEAERPTWTDKGQRLIFTVIWCTTRCRGRSSYLSTYPRWREAVSYVTSKWRWCY